MTTSTIRCKKPPHKANQEGRHRMNSAGKIGLTAIAILVLIAPAFGYGVYHFSVVTPSLNQNLSTPTTVHQPISDNLALLTATALQYRGNSQINKTVNVPDYERTNFKAHLTNAGAQRGWLVQPTDQGDLTIVMPRNHLQILDEMILNPITWVTKRPRSIPTKNGPTDLITVNL